MKSGSGANVRATAVHGDTIRFRIPPGRLLDPGEGLLVVTPPMAGDTHYAVAPVTAAGRSGDLMGLTRPVREVPELPSAVFQDTMLIRGRFEVKRYVHWTNEGHGAGNQTEHGSSRVPVTGVSRWMKGARS